MIELQTQRRLERRLNRLYAHLGSILQSASVHQVENIMRQIHGINLKLRIYFKGGIDRHPQELFINPDEDNDITTQDTATCEISPSTEELSQIEAEIKAGKI